MLDTTDRAHANDTQPPERLPVKLLIQVFNSSRIFADRHRGKIFDCTHYRARLPLQRGFPPSKHPRFVGLDFREDPITHLTIHHDGFDSSDLRFSP